MLLDHHFYKNCVLSLKQLDYIDLVCAQLGNTIYL